MRLGVCIAAMLLSACGTDLSWLKEDTATACGHITTIYGQAQFARTNCVDCNVQCDSNGLTVKQSQGSGSIPVTIIPTPQVPSK